MALETNSSNPVLSYDERSKIEWGRLWKSSDQNIQRRMEIINSGRTPAMEATAGAMLGFHEEIGSAESVTVLGEGFDCIVAPMLGDTSVWGRVTAAADLTFGVLARLHQAINDEKVPPEKPGSDHSVITGSIRVLTSPDHPIDTKREVELHARMDTLPRTTRGAVLFDCVQDGKSVGSVQVMYFYKSEDEAAEMTKGVPEEIKALALQKKDLPLPRPEEVTEMYDQMGITFSPKNAEGYDAKYTPYLYCSNYWGTVHGSGLVAFALAGIAEANRGFTVKYKAPAIPDFDPAYPDKPSVKSFFRKRTEKGVEIHNEAGALLVEITFGGKGGS